MKVTALFFFLMLMLTTFSGKTQEVQKDSTGILEEVIVSATRTNTKSFLLPFSSTSLTAKEIAASGARTTPEALAQSAGVFVQKTNHGGGSAFVRGLTGNQTLIMMDGIRFNNATFRFGPNQYLNTVDVYSVDKVEVIKGSGSVQYGSDAIGGVIQIFTTEPSFGRKAFKSKVYGKIISQDMEYSARAEIAYQSNKMAFSAGYTTRKFGDLFGGDTTGRQFLSGYKEHAFDAKLKFMIGENTILTASHQSVVQNDVPLYHRIKLENYAYYLFDPQQRNLSYLKLETKTNNWWMRSVNITLSSQNTSEKRSYYRNGNVNRFVEEDKVATSGATLDVFSVAGKHWQINSGVEYYHDKINSAKLQQAVTGNVSLALRGLYPEGASTNNFSLYSLHHFNFGKFNAEAGVRYNAVAINIPDTSLQSGKPSEVTVKPTSLVVNLGLVYTMNKRSGVFVGFSTGYRVPNVDDLGSLGLVDFRFEIPAFGLKPEKSYHTEIGYRFHSTKLQTEVSLFYMHLNDLITRVQVPGQQINGYNVYTKVNSQQSYMKGGEFTFKYKLSELFRLNGGVAYCFGQNLSANEPMRRIPPFNGRLQLTYQKKRWQAGMEDVFAEAQRRLAQGDKDDNRIPIGGTPGWNLININGGFDKDQYSIQGGIGNLLNVDYRTHGSGINGMGRNIWLSIHFKL